MPSSGANSADDAIALDDALQHAGLSPDEAALKMKELTQALDAHGVCTIGRRQRVLRLLHERLAQSECRTVAPPSQHVSQPSTPPPVQSPLASPLTPPQTLPQLPTMPPDAVVAPQARARNRARARDCECIEALLRAGAAAHAVQKTDNATAAHLSCAARCPTCLRRLLQRAPHLTDGARRDGAQPLHCEEAGSDCL